MCTQGTLTASLSQVLTSPVFILDQIFGWLISPAKNRIPLLVSSFAFRLHHILRICPRNLTSFTRRFLSRSRGAILSNTHYGSHSLASWLWIPSQIFLVKVVFFFHFAGLVNLCDLCLGMRLQAMKAGVWDSGNETSSTINSHQMLCHWNQKRKPQFCGPSQQHRN